MIHDWLSRQAHAISSSALPVPMGRREWKETLEQRRTMWLEMIGLWPLPERTPLEPTITGVLERDGYVVEKLHLQPEPGCYLTANVVRPAEVTAPLPCILYHCGHSAPGKAQPRYHGLARYYALHGYLCLIFDTIEIGEGLGQHRGTARGGRWDWQSRGYSPLGTEVWHGMRAIDYLETREDADATRVGTTGISGGGVLSWYHPAADERVTASASVCGIGSLEMLVAERLVDGHCDCVMWSNYYQWDWPQIGALVAPRPLLVASGAHDPIWRPHAYQEMMHRVRQVYAALDAEGNLLFIDELVPHTYTERSRMGTLEWFDRHLKGIDEPVTEDMEPVEEPAENLAVFPDGEHPPDQMPRVYDFICPTAPPPEVEGAMDWVATQERMLGELRRLSFRQIPREITPVLQHMWNAGGSGGAMVGCDYDPGDGMVVRARLRLPRDPDAPPAVLLAANLQAGPTYFMGGAEAPGSAAGIGLCMAEVRGSGLTAMHEDLARSERRSLAAMGYTLAERQILDLLAALRVFAPRFEVGTVATFGRGPTCVHAIYAALLDESIAEIVLESPPETLTDPATPPILGALRVADLPQALALAFPRPITFVGEPPESYRWTRDLYERLGRGDCIRCIDDATDWQPYENR